MKTCSLLFLCFYSTLLFGQIDTLSGVVNTYAEVLEIDTCEAKLCLSSSSSFEAGQSAFLIQMQGAQILEDNNNNFGTITDLNSAGLFERCEIDSIAGDCVFLKKHLVHDYQISGAVQLISIPEYENAVVAGSLTAAPWDGTTGGVLIIDVQNTLTLNAPVTTNGQGFRGGQINVLESNCQFFLNQDNYFYEIDNWRGAPKGEGIAKIIPNKESGRGPQANGGGGGNDHNSGGGGGSHLTQGGTGGEHEPPSIFGCSGPFPGIGGKPLNADPQRLFLGGGGGAGHTDNQGAGERGGNGGGIIILLAQTLDGNDFAIMAEGENAPLAEGDGAGGGGAGGSIFLQYDNLLSAPSLSVRGGNGGDTDNPSDRCFGPGGGGSGGRIGLDDPTAFTIDLNGGIAGINESPSSACNDSTSGAQNGMDGEQASFPGIPSGSEDVEATEIITHPVPAVTVCEPGELNLSVEASGPDISYQWQINPGTGWEDLLEDAMFSGTQTSQLMVTDLTITFDGAQFRCLVSSSCLGPIISDATLVEVKSPPVPGFTFDITGSTSVQFTNTSLNADQFSWNFGDGSPISTLSDPEHTYPEEGEYIVTLSIDDDCGLFTFTDTLILGTPPVAGFNASPTGGCAPLVIEFNDLSSGNITSWEWSFPGGDPDTSTDPNPVINYTTEGNYEVSLTVTNDFGTNTLAIPNYLEILDFPTAAFDFTVSGDTLFLNNLSSGVGLFYQWNFGDGSPISDEENPFHVYDTMGVYDVTLTAQNTYCGSTTTSSIGIGLSNTSAAYIDKAFRIAPNPTDQWLQIKKTGQMGTPLRIELISSSGQLAANLEMGNGEYD
jgi:PKD repeat protein